MNVCSKKPPSSDDCIADSLIPNILAGLCSFWRSDFQHYVSCTPDLLAASKPENVCSGFVQIMSYMKSY